MSSFVRVRSDSKNPPVAVLVPGSGYTVRAPLLYWCAEILAQQGWHVQGIDWTIAASAWDDPQSFAELAVAEAFDSAPQTDQRLIIAKSFGCFALPWARRQGIPGVWLTPVLTDGNVCRALRDATPADLAVGGDADALWLPEEVAGTRATVITVPGADHSLALPGNWRGSLAAQSVVFEGIEKHLQATQARP